MSERPRIPSLRDLRVILPDGRELAVEGVEEVGPGEPRRLGASGEVTFVVEMSAGQSAALRYLLWVRPWLYCPVEYRLN